LPKALSPKAVSRSIIDRMSGYPDKLTEILDMFEMFSDPTERAQLLLSFSDQFQPVPSEVARRPYPGNHRIPQCESDAYAWAVTQPDDTLKLYFAVENPSGISARALATILDKSLSGLPAEQIAHVSPEIVERIFRQNISMGKGMGLMSMVLAVRALAERAMRAPEMVSNKPVCPD
jgi:cysteine desulfuration protein SufE